MQEEHWYPLNRRLGGPQSPPGWFWGERKKERKKERKTTALPGFKPWATQLIGSCYIAYAVPVPQFTASCYTGYAVPAPCMRCYAPQKNSSIFLLCLYMSTAYHGVCFTTTAHT